MFGFLVLILRFDCRAIECLEKANDLSGRGLLCRVQDEYLLDDSSYEFICDGAQIRPPLIVKD